MQSAFGILIIHGLKRFLWVMSFPFDVIWRHHMGERQCTWFRLWLHTWLISMICLAGGMADKTADQLGIGQKFGKAPIVEKSNVDQSADQERVKFEQIDAISKTTLYASILAGVIWTFGLLNIMEIKNKVKAGIPWHTRFYGVPRFLPDTRLTHAFLIPLGTILIGLWVKKLSDPIGNYILVAGIMQAVVFRYEEWVQRQRFLDIQDRGISVENMTAAIDGKDAMQCAGLVVSGIARPEEIKKMGASRLVSELSQEDIRNRFKDVITDRSK